jgi:hypothetical protein
LGSLAVMSNDPFSGSTAAKRADDKNMDLLAFAARCVPKDSVVDFGRKGVTASTTLPVQSQKTKTVIQHRAKTEPNDLFAYKPHISTCPHKNCSGIMLSCSPSAKGHHLTWHQPMVQEGGVPSIRARHDRRRNARSAVTSTR